MMVPSSVPTRRSIPQSAQTTRQLIVFQLRQEWFGLSVEAAQKLIPTNSMYQSPEVDGDRFTLYQNQEVPILALEQCLFGDQPVRHLLPAAGDNCITKPTTVQQPCLLIVQATNGQLAALSLPAQPTLRRVSQANLTPLLDYDAATYYHRWISLVAAQAENQQTIFILDLDRLIQLGLQ